MKQVSVCMLGFAAVVGCSSASNNPSAGTGGTSGSGGESSSGTQAAATLPPGTPGMAMTCTDFAIENDPRDDQSHGSVATATQFEACVYNPQTHVLFARYLGQNGQYFHVRVTGYHGPGAYQTGGDDEATNVTVRGSSPAAGTFTDVTSHGGEGAHCPPTQCTITASGTLDATGADNNARTGDLEVSCPAMHAGGVGCVQCNVTSGPTRLHVPSCEIQ